jgi:hypothetical protein
MSRRVRRVSSSSILLAAAAAGLLAGGAGARVGGLPTLYANYSMNCTFTITNDAGAPVTAVAPGTYQVAINTPGDFGAVNLTGVYDYTACKGFAQFQMTGPGVNVYTTLDDGDSDFALFTVMLQASSSYVAQDNNQPTVARAVVTTLASGSPSQPATTTSNSATSTSTTPAKPATTTGTPAVLGSLSGAVSAAGKASLGYKGKPLKTLKAGRYTITVTDSSTKSGLSLEQGNLTALSVTGTRFVGTRSVTLALAAGKWVFYAAPLGRKTAFVVS